MCVAYTPYAQRLHIAQYDGSCSVPHTLFSTTLSCSWNKPHRIDTNAMQSACGYPWPFSSPYPTPALAEIGETTVRVRDRPLSVCSTSLPPYLPTNHNPIQRLNGNSIRYDRSVTYSSDLILVDLLFWAGLSTYLVTLHLSLRLFTNRRIWGLDRPPNLKWRVLY